MKKIALIGAFLLLALSAPTLALAEVAELCPPGDDFNALCATTPDIGSIISTIVQILLIGAVVVALFFLIWGGIKWITSGGDKAKVESARSTIIGAIIGLVIAFAAFMILTVVASLFGLEGGILDLEIPSFLGGSDLPRDGSAPPLPGASGDPAGDCIAGGGSWNNGSCR